MTETPSSNGDGPSDEELVAILVERGVPEPVALERVAKIRRETSTILSGKGEPIPIDEAEIDAWLSAGSFG
ncbi:MAG: hypothetical protein H0U46_10130 [Actinobacteria bacterium]|nr:hypothetical protein [Actinomycetota bacterium]